MDQMEVDSSTGSGGDRGGGLPIEPLLVSLSLPIESAVFPLLCNQQDIGLLRYSVGRFLPALPCRKGPVERISFPTLSQTQSPFMQLGQFLHLLGKKIDAAQNHKAGFLLADHVDESFVLEQ